MGEQRIGSLKRRRFRFANGRKLRCLGTALSPCSPTTPSALPTVSSRAGKNRGTGGVGCLSPVAPHASPTVCLDGSLERCFVRRSAAEFDPERSSSGAGGATATHFLPALAGPGGQSHCASGGRAGAAAVASRPFPRDVGEAGRRQREADAARAGDLIAGRRADHDIGGFFRRSPTPTVYCE